MIELERHIETLLLDNDCVIVPGLGGFIAHHVDARYDSRDNMFLPPLRTLGFNPKLNMNDSLLAQSYVEAYDISYPEALAKIDSEVDELKQSVEREGVYELENIGVILLNENGNYEFEPCESGILTPELYGLSGVEIELRSDGKQAHSLVVPDKLYAPTEPTITISQTDDKSKTTEASALGQSHLVVGGKEEDRTIKIKVSLLRNVFAAACAIVAFFLLSTPISTEVYENGQKMSSVANGLLYNLVQTGMPKADVSQKDDFHTKNVSVKVQNAIAKKDSMTKILVAEEKAETTKRIDTTNTSKDNYCIVLACRITKTNAENFVAKLQSDGYKDTRVIGRVGSSLKVVYGSYVSEKEALSNLDSLRKNETFREAWIYHIK